MLEAVSELVVQVVEFVNLDLARKGVYRVEFSLAAAGSSDRSDGGSGPALATPYSTFAGAAPARSRVGRRWMPQSDEIADGPLLRSDAGTYVTRAMLVRFNEERYELAEVGPRDEWALVG
jgi:hypothetical protein